MTEKVDKIAERISELREMRQAGVPLNWSERHRIATEIYDSCLLDWAIVRLQGGSQKQCGALTFQLERARLEANALESRVEKSDISESKVETIGWAVSDETTANA
jgi:hypothetical protein